MTLALLHWRLEIDWQTLEGCVAIGRSAMIVRMDVRAAVEADV